MMTNAELRLTAWQQLWKGGWFWKIFSVSILLGLCGFAAQLLLDGVFEYLNIEDFQDFRLHKLLNRLDVTHPIPVITREYFVQMGFATAVQTFVGWIFTAITAFGTSSVVVKCIRGNDRGDWLGDAFQGFRRPFALLWQFIRLVLVYIGWTLLGGVLLAPFYFFVIAPCLRCSENSFVDSALLVLALMFWISLMIALFCVPFYRYRFMWLVRAENPDISAGECMRRTRALMKGNKFRSFKLDCSYWRPFTLILILAILVCFAGGVGAYAYQCGNWLVLAGLIFVLVLSVIALFVLSLVVGYYIHLGQAYLYKEISGEA